jgi:transposase-like protein
MKNVCPLCKREILRELKDTKPQGEQWFRCNCCGEFGSLKDFERWANNRRNSKGVVT